MRQSHRDLCEDKASLTYRVSSTTARDTQRNRVLKIKKNREGKKKYNVRKAENQTGRFRSKGCEVGTGHRQKSV